MQTTVATISSQLATQTADFSRELLERDRERERDRANDGENVAERLQQLEMMERQSMLRSDEEYSAWADDRRFSQSQQKVASPISPMRGTRVNLQGSEIDKTAQTKSASTSTRERGECDMVRVMRERVRKGSAEKMDGLAVHKVSVWASVCKGWIGFYV